VINRDTGRRLGVVGGKDSRTSTGAIVMALGLPRQTRYPFRPDCALDGPGPDPPGGRRDHGGGIRPITHPELQSRVRTARSSTKPGWSRNQESKLGRGAGLSSYIETPANLTTLGSGLAAALLGEGVLSTWRATAGENVTQAPRPDHCFTKVPKTNSSKNWAGGLLEKLRHRAPAAEQDGARRYRQRRCQ